MRLYNPGGKRLFDIIVSAAMIIILSPVIVIVALAVKLQLGSPVIFKHSRPGKDTEIFELYKFRTMSNERDETGKLLPDKDRITNFGALLRKSSLDELPEFFNIIKGDMSLIGPRPLLSRYLPFYSADEMKRFTVLPGLTGWAQVHGRNSVNWEERLAYDAWYAENITFLLDLRILLATLKMVLKREGVVVVPDSAMKSLDTERLGNEEFNDPKS